MNKEIMKALFPEEFSRVESGRCPFCNGEVNENDFRDDKSLSEFRISGICQECQDKTFSNE
jgi:hypothetical protein